MLSRRTRILLAVLVVASLTFVILDLRGGQGPFASVRTVASNVLGGLERAAATVFSPITGASSWWSDMRDQAAQIDDPRGGERPPAQRAGDPHERPGAGRRTRRAAAGVERGRVPVRAGRGHLRRPGAGLLVDDHDRRRPQRRHRAGHVRDQRGRPGRAGSLKTTASTSTVVLIVDASSAVGGRVADDGGDRHRRRERAARTRWSSSCSTRWPTCGVGDALVTFGSKGGRPFAPGLPIGEVVDVSGAPGQLTRVATVRPFVDVSQLEHRRRRDQAPARGSRATPCCPGPPASPPLPRARRRSAASTAVTPHRTEETAATRKEANASPSASAVPEQETPASAAAAGVPTAADGKASHAVAPGAHHRVADPRGGDRRADAAVAAGASRGRHPTSSWSRSWRSRWPWDRRRAPSPGSRPAS